MHAHAQRYRYTCTCTIPYSQRSHQEKVFTTFTTCSHWWNFFITFKSWWPLPLWKKLRRYIVAGLSKIIVWWDFQLYGTYMHCSDQSYTILYKQAKPSACCTRYICMLQVCKLAVYGHWCMLSSSRVTTRMLMPITYSNMYTSCACKYASVPCVYMYARSADSLQEA